MYSVPGKRVGLRSARGNQTLVAFFLFKQPTPLRYDHHDLAQQKHLLASVFAGEAWEVPRLLEKMQTAPDLYFDAVSQIRMETWSHGRAVLLGDAGYCPALLSGQGSTLAMMGAYILAGELKVTLGDHQRAFPVYEQAFRPVVSRVQKKAGSAAQFLVPATPVGANSLEPAATPASADGCSAREGIAPHVLFKAEQVKGLWEWFPDILTKACSYGIDAEVSFH